MRITRRTVIGIALAALLAVISVIVLVIQNSQKNPTSSPASSNTAPANSIDACKVLSGQAAAAALGLRTPFKAVPGNNDDQPDCTYSKTASDGNTLVAELTIRMEDRWTFNNYWTAAERDYIKERLQNPASTAEQQGLAADDFPDTMNIVGRYEHTEEHDQYFLHLNDRKHTIKIRVQPAKNQIVPPTLHRTIPDLRSLGLAVATSLRDSK